MDFPICLNTFLAPLRLLLFHRDQVCANLLIHLIHSNSWHQRPYSFDVQTVFFLSFRPEILAESHLYVLPYSNFFLKLCLVHQNLA